MKSVHILKALTSCALILVTHRSTAQSLTDTSGSLPPSGDTSISAALEEDPNAVCVPSDFPEPDAEGDLFVLKNYLNESSPTSSPTPTSGPEASGVTDGSASSTSNPDANYSTSPLEPTPVPVSTETSYTGESSSPSIP